MRDCVFRRPVCESDHNERVNSYIQPKLHCKNDHTFNVKKAIIKISELINGIFPYSIQ